MSELKKHLKHTRVQYDKGILAENHLDADPISQFEIWMQEAIQSGMADPNAMDLCTVHLGKPSSRIVLLKEVDKRGFVFFTNYLSRKGFEMEKNPHVCLNFFWPALVRQVRIEGVISHVSPEESDEYFMSRPRESQIGAWASDQSQRLESRQVLEDRVKELMDKFEGQSIPRPPHWGGYLVRPERIEFWQGRLNRLHDRFVYELEDGNWSVFRLFP